MTGNEAISVPITRFATTPQVKKAQAVSTDVAVVPHNCVQAFHFRLRWASFSRKQRDQSQLGVHTHLG